MERKREKLFDADTNTWFAFDSSEWQLIYTIPTGKEGWHRKSGRKHIYRSPRLCKTTNRYRYVIYGYDWYPTKGDAKIWECRATYFPLFRAARYDKENFQDDDWL